MSPNAAPEAGTVLICYAARRFGEQPAARGAVMRFGAVLGLAIGAMLGASGIVRAAGPEIPDDLVTVRLVAEKPAIAAGETSSFAVHFEIKPGWHIYWRNPGDSGLPTTVAWRLPAGFTAGEIDWPAPAHFVLGGIGNYGYAGAADLLVPVTAPARIDAGATVPIAADVGWLACADICIPGEATLHLDLRVTDAASPADPAVAASFAAARAKVPIPAAFDTRFAMAKDGVRVIVPAAAFDGLEQPTVAFFPFDANALDNAADPVQRRQGDSIELVFGKSSNPAASVPATLDGVLVVKGGSGAERVFAVTANPVTGAVAADEELPAWWAALGLAFLGGLVLNLMPCVFPVLSLKVLSLTAASDAGERRRHGIAYAAGVVVSFAVLGGVLLGLRSGGAAIGWGFQLQSPVVVGILAYLLFAMGLSLSGVAEFGATLAGVGGRFAAHPGVGGSFAAGVLATIVATPCTAPFMGAALGFALVAPPALGLAVFIVLGLGLAAPLTLTALTSGIGRLLPRPGPWMVLLKQLLAFPLYGTVAWLMWVLLQEVGPQGALAALFGLVCVGFAVWVYGLTSLAGPAARRLGAGLAAAGALAAILLAATVGPAGANAVTKPAHDGLAYEAFTPDRLDALIAAHKPVFVNLTAAWCLTCLFNETATLDTVAVRQAFAAGGVVALKGDWTRQDPAITAFLRKFGRSGVPLYLFYDGGGTPTVLPQILTESGVLAVLGKG